MNFTIDLLKGRGLPVKNRPEGVAAGVVIFAVPVIAAIVIFGCYLTDSVAMSVQKQQISNYRQKTKDLADAVEIQRSFEQKQDLLSSYLSEVSQSVSRHCQWSPVVAMVVENMPDSMILTKLQVEQNYVRKQITKKTTPPERVTVTLPERTLHIVLSGDSQSGYEEAVREFRDRLRCSALLESRLDDIRVSQKIDSFDGRDVVSYKIDCIFKPGL